MWIDIQSSFVGWVCRTRHLLKTSPREKSLPTDVSNQLLWYYLGMVEKSNLLLLSPDDFILKCINIIWHKKETCCEHVLLGRNCRRSQERHCAVCPWTRLSPWLPPPPSPGCLAVFLYFCIFVVLYFSLVYFCHWIFFNIFYIFLFVSWFQWTRQIPLGGSPQKKNIYTSGHCIKKYLGNPIEESLPQRTEHLQWGSLEESQFHLWGKFRQYHQ